MPLPPARRHAAHAGPVGDGEVVPVAPGGYSELEPLLLPLIDHGLNMAFDCRRLSGAGEAGDEQVVTRLVNLQAKLDGVDRPVLADEPFQGGYLVGAIEL